MTIETMRWHEGVNVHYDKDFRRQSIVRLALRHVRGPKVLDMRCITGSLVFPLLERGMDVSALDGYDGAVETTNSRCRELGHAGVAQAWDLTGLVERVGENNFDTVVCLDVLNHALDDEHMMSEIVRVVKPGGRLILAIPAFPFLLGKRDKSLGHLRRYTRAQARGLLERHGFVVDKMRFWNFIALPLYALLESVMKVRISDGFRYGWWGALGSLPNRVFTMWYLAVENNVTLPYGMTHFILAHRPTAAEPARN